MRYNGNYRRIPICNWAYECSVEKMYSWYENWKDENFVRTCGIKNTDSETMFSFVMIELAIIIVIVVSMLKGYLDRKQEKEKYIYTHRHYMHE